MAQSDPSSMQELRPGYPVQAPRRSDAIGLALRDAYDRDLGLPDDMAMMLRRLNTVTTTDPR